VRWGKIKRKVIVDLTKRERNSATELKKKLDAPIGVKKKTPDFIRAHFY